MGRSGMSRDGSSWLMHARSSQMRGSRWFLATKSARQAWSARHLASGSSLHECETKASTSSKTAGSVSRYHAASFSMSKTSGPSLSALIIRNRDRPTSTARRPAAPPKRLAMPAAADMFLPVAASHACTHRRAVRDRAKRPQPTKKTIPVMVRRSCVRSGSAGRPTLRTMALTVKTREKTRYQTPMTSQRRSRSCRVVRGGGTRPSSAAFWQHVRPMRCRARPWNRYSAMKPDQSCTKSKSMKP
mmetsp:Transcript_13867/g.46892  ORF Transcript_13867/g.46892 Transcript_13867/m.46892 type:complete len:244 (+) Transcript_13867:1358-2089(+)